jgi:hypothetical protein
MPHYRIKKFTTKDRDTWSVEDTRTGRIVAVYVNENAAVSLTHTLNVADLSSSIVAFDAEA